MFKHLRSFNRKVASGFHFDVMDGDFVPRLGLYPELLKSMRSKTDLPIEVHLMLGNPDKFFELFANYGCTRLILHYRNPDHLMGQIANVRELGLEVGIALNPEVPVNSLHSVIHLLDVVMLMAIKPGVPKHPFIEGTYAKIVELVKLAKVNNLTFKISIDGGVTFNNISKLVEIGADILICGSGTIFHEGQSFRKNLKLLGKYTK
jgi:ribulose-phosphate 3-epimerase